MLGNSVGSFHEIDAAMQEQGEAILEMIKKSGVLEE
jgi:hypothetical protein